MDLADCNTPGAFIRRNGNTDSVLNRFKLMKGNVEAANHFLFTYSPSKQAPKPK